jgi:predicted alpha/beta hydrolase family esterase
MQETLAQDSISLEVPELDKNQETKYSIWKEKLDAIGIAQYDTIVAHSFGCPVSMQYIIENQIAIDRLVLIAPSGMKGNAYLEKVLPEMTADVTELKKYVSEIVIIHSEDDGSSSAPFSYGQFLAEKI